MESKSDDRQSADLEANEFEVSSDDGLSTTFHLDTEAVSDNFRLNFRRIRHERRVTLDALASTLGVSKPTVWAWEKGKGKPKIERLPEIARALSVTVEDLQESPFDALSLQEVLDECRFRVSSVLNIKRDAVRIIVDL